MLCSGICDSEGDVSELEEALAETINQALFQSESVQRHVTLLCQYVYEVLTCNGIMLSIVKHGTTKLCTSSLRNALCRCMADVVRNVGYQADVHLDVVQRLVSEIGMHNTSDGLSSVVLIHEIIHFELLNSAVPSSFYHQQNIAGRPAVVNSLNGVSGVAAVRDGSYQLGSGAVSYTHLTLPTKRIV